MNHARQLAAGPRAEFDSYAPAPTGTPGVGAPGHTHGLPAHNQPCQGPPRGVIFASPASIDHRNEDPHAGLHIERTGDGVGEDVVDAGDRDGDVGDQCEATRGIITSRGASAPT